MKKVIYLLVLTLFASNVTAVNNATGPNKVYIEQVGSSNVLTLEQVGGTNNIGGVGGTVTVSNTDNSTTITPDAPSSTNYAYINGATNTITINQHGDNNWAQYSIRGNNNQYTSNVTGSNNKTKLVLGDLTTNNLRNVIMSSIKKNPKNHTEESRKKFAPRSDTPTMASADPFQKLPEALMQADPAMMSQILPNFYKQFMQIRNLLTAFDYNEDSDVPDVLAQVIMGTVGEGFGTEFIQFLNDFKLQQLGDKLEDFINFLKTENREKIITSVLTSDKL